MSEERIDRLEALAEKILEGLEQTKQRTDSILEGLEQTKQRTDSNARAIEALTNQWAESKKEWEKDRKGLYLLLGRLTKSMSDFYEIQSDFYNRFDQIDSRQADITKILQNLKENKNESEDQKN
jgi:uncharacterized coiled-coil protein SlyX